MDFAQQQRNPGRHTIGIGIVLALHLLLGWAVVSGLAQRVVDVIKAPIETKIIEETKPPPPPPPENLPPPPKFAPPPPSFVPPPEIQVNPPPTPAPTITVTREAPPPAPVTIGPPPAPAAPPAPPAPAPVARVAPRPVISDFQGCAPRRDEYPAPAVRAEASGITTVRVNVDAAGRITSVDVVKSAGPTREHKMLDRLVVSKITNFCKAAPARDEEGKPVAGSTQVEYVWKLD
ncbi:MAG: energy transducer TonB [Rubrivivax sp.]